MNRMDEAQGLKEDMAKIKLSRVADEVLKKRYFARNYRGEILETPEDLFRRVARSVAEADRLFEANASVKKTAGRFEEAMASLSFLPNSPCLMHAGRPMGQLAACFVLPIEDNLESIFQSLKETALIPTNRMAKASSVSRVETPMSRRKRQSRRFFVGVASGSGCEFKGNVSKLTSI